MCLDNKNIININVRTRNDMNSLMHLTIANIEDAEEIANTAVHSR